MIVSPSGTSALGVHEDGALRGEGVHDVGVVDDLPAHVDRRAELLEHPLDGLDGTVDAGAVAAGGDELELLGHGPRVPDPDAYRPGVGAIATLEAGTGPTVLLIHGLNGFKEGWGPLPEALAAGGARAWSRSTCRASGPAPASPRPHRARTPWPRALEPLVSSLAPVGVVGALAGHPGRHDPGRAAARDREPDGADLALGARPADAAARRARCRDLVQIPLVGRRRSRAWPSPASAAAPSAAATPTSRRRRPGGADGRPRDGGPAAGGERPALHGRPAGHGRLGRRGALGTDVRPLAARLPQPTLVGGGGARPRHPAAGRGVAGRRPSGGPPAAAAGRRALPAPGGRPPRCSPPLVEHLT